MTMVPLTVTSLLEKAKAFADYESAHWEPSLYGVSDGKAVGTYLEQKFTAWLAITFEFEKGNSANGIDLPGLGIDIKTTSIKQPQSSCPYRSPSQKVYGLGYGLLVFVYDKKDDASISSAKLQIIHTLFIEKELTADFQMTHGLQKLLENDANTDDIIAFLNDKNLQIEEIGAQALAERILAEPPALGALTISNALQWRLQYSRAIKSAGLVAGIHKVV